MVMIYKERSERFQRQCACDVVHRTIQFCIININMAWIVDKAVFPVPPPTYDAKGPIKIYNLQNFFHRVVRDDENESHFRTYGASLFYTETIQGVQVPWWLTPRVSPLILPFPVAHCVPCSAAFY